MHQISFPTCHLLSDIFLMPFSFQNISEAGEETRFSVTLPYHIFATDTHRRTQTFLEDDI